MFVGVDVGGTFTDLVLFDEETGESPEVIKIPTSSKQPEQAIIETLRKYGRRRRISLVSHATTIATNALLTHTGLAKTALITNNGFRDILEIGRQRRPEIYNLQTKRPIPLVERRDRFVVRERTLSDGTIQRPVSRKDFLRVAREIRKSRFASAAIAFLNSYANPQQERTVERFLRHSGFKGYIDVSSQIDPQYREYERTSTAVVNASLAPLMSRYLSRLKAGLERLEISCPVYVMNSDGTASTIVQASRSPVSMIESGPAAGVLSAESVAQRLSLQKVITFDMGGTTAKAGTIIGGRPDLAYEFEAAGRNYHGRSIKGSGYPVRQPFIDLAEVSAGGGTIAWLDDSGSLMVGPKSAGADPGPAAYGRGGKQATVTDANIIAGRISPTHLLGGQLRLRRDLAAEAVRGLGRRLGKSAEKTAESILRIVNNNMSKALSLVSIERGRDPREFTLVAFGGAGPLHACDLADELRIKRIIVPQHAGLFSAFGLLTAELSRTFSLPILKRATHLIEGNFRELRERAERSLKQEGLTNYRMMEQVDLRYRGQAHEITLPYQRNANLAQMFGRVHKKLYGYSSNDTVEAVNARVRAIIHGPKSRTTKSLLRHSKAKPSTSRKVLSSDKWATIPIYQREALWAGATGRGPSIIEEYDSTIMIGEAWSWKINQYGDVDMQSTRVT